MEIKNPNQYGGLSETYLNSFELKINAILPNQYRTFLLNFNGGCPSPCSFDITGNDGSTLHSVYGLHAGPDYCQLLKMYEIFKKRIPKAFLAIADDPFGNQICIGLKGKYFGKVYFWDHEQESLFFKNKGISFIANSLDQFLEGLYEYVDPDETEVKKAVRLGDRSYVFQMITNGYDIELLDENGRTIIECCAIHRKNDLIRFLFDQGASLRSSLELAEKNAKYFEEHKKQLN